MSVDEIKTEEQLAPTSRRQEGCHVYLKVNFLAAFVFRNVQRWVNVLESQKGVSYFVVCRSEVEKAALEKSIKFQGNMAGFILVDMSEEVLAIVRYTCKEKWHNAALMHMTPFLHAINHDIGDFWCIDADVCHVCLSGQRTWKMLSRAVKYADEKDMNLFSLDIWQSSVKYLQKKIYGHLELLMCVEIRTS